MKTLEYIYRDSQIHFLVNPLDKNVMINATEMAQMFGKRVNHFTRSSHAKSFINILEKEIIRTPNGGRIIDNRGRNGIYFNRLLALKFAAWLNPEFEFWVFSKIEEISFGNYKKHWDAHVKQEQAREKMQMLKSQLLDDPNKEVAEEYFEAEQDFALAKNAKTAAIKSQSKLFG